DRELRIRGPRLRGARADAHRGLEALARDDPDALPLRLRLGQPARHGAEHHPPDPHRRDPDRADEPASTGTARHPARGHRRMEPLPERRAVSKSFGGLLCIDKLDLHVNEGEIVSVIGPNGAGKTTLFTLVTGVYGADDGDTRFAGESVLGLEPH